MVKRASKGKAAATTRKRSSGSGTGATVVKRGGLYVVMRKDRNGKAYPATVHEHKSYADKAAKRRGKR